MPAARRQARASRSGPPGSMAGAAATPCATCPGSRTQAAAMRGRQQGQRRQHPVHGGETAVQCQRGQQQRADRAAERYGCLADAHGQAPLALGEPLHDGPAAGAIDAAPSRPTSTSPPASSPPRRHMPGRRHGPEGHGCQGQRGACQPCQQHGPVAPAVGEHAPRHFAHGDAQPHEAQHQPEDGGIELVAAAHHHGGHGDAAEGDGKRRVGAHPGRQHFPAVAGTGGTGDGRPCGTGRGHRSAGRHAAQCPRPRPF